MPFEMITMLGSTVLGGVMSIWSQSIKAKQAEQKMLLARAEVQQKGFKEAREYGNEGFQWTRRIIALTAVFAIVLLPKLMPVLQPDVTVIVGYLEFNTGSFLYPHRDKWRKLHTNSVRCLCFLNYTNKFEIEFLVKNNSNIINLYFYLFVLMKYSERKPLQVCFPWTALTKIIWVSL